MASIKQLLETAMLRLGSRGSRDGDKVVSVAVDQSSSDMQSFVAPADGFYKASGKATHDSGALFCDGGGERTFYRVRALWVSAPLTFTWPCKKGSTIRVQYVNIVDRTLSFIKSVGGGV